MSIATDLAPPKRQRVRVRERRIAGGMAALNVAAFVLGIAIWSLIAALGVGDLPGPLKVLDRAGQLIGDGTLLSDTAASLRRVLLGFALGSLCAVPVGFLMGWYRVARGLIEPYV